MLASWRRKPEPAAAPFSLCAPLPADPREAARIVSAAERYNGGMWESEGPYTADELRAMRRLIRAAGLEIDAWALKTRRSAEFVRQLSPSQADVITTQALAVASAPADCGSDEQIAAAEALFAAVEPGERQKRLWHLLLEFRHRHYPEIEPEQ